jgi:VWFA-related protein
VRLTHRIFFLLAASVLCAAGVSAQKTQPPSQTATPAPPPAASAADDGDEVERVSVHVVSLPVSVTDRDGRFVPDLRESDFRVSENGRDQSISYFASVEQPFTVMLLLDTSGSTSIRLHDIQTAAVDFVNQLRPQDRVLPVAFDNDAVALLSDWSSDRAVLTRSIRSARTGMIMGEKDREVRVGPEGKKVVLQHINTRLYDAFYKSAETLRQVGGRKAIILFTDGYDNASRLATRASTLTLAEELDALVYVVQFTPNGNYAPGERPAAGNLGGPGARPVTGPSVNEMRQSSAQMTAAGVSAPSPTRASPIGGGSPSVLLSRPMRPFEQRRPKALEVERYLEGLAERTGGRFYVAADMNKIRLAFAAVADELRRMYSIGYHPTPLAKPGQRREVKISVRRERVAVRARRAYVFRPR